MQLGYNEIMIVSKYFEDINDFINLEIGIKRFRGNMERFHFNPIPLNQYSRKLFPNIETFHIYNEEDEIFKDGRIIKQIIWYKVSYSKYLKEKEEMNECKNIKYTEEDRKKYGNTIPIEVTSLGNYCFIGCTSLISINIPTSVIEIGNRCFYECTSLTTINIPTNVSKIGDSCFEECTSLTSITVPPSVTKIGYGCFYKCTSLTTINIEDVKYISKERIFMNEPVLISIEIPKNLKMINGKKIKKKDINEFIIPSTITKIGDYCFEYCSSLTTINIPTSVSKIGNYCFYGCSSLQSINIPSSIISFGVGCFYHCGCEEELKKNETIPKNCFKEY
ncbi:leucine rich repeat protein, BspA family [Entamoeba histolytica]